MYISIDKKCIGCGLCKNVCPAHVIDLNNQRAKIVKEEVCLSCGHCAAICPTDAISSVSDDHRSFNTSNEVAETMIIDALNAKRSIRNFKNITLTDAQISTIIKAANCAPSATNNRYSKFLVITDRKKLAYISRQTMSMLSLVPLLLNPIILFVIGLFSKRQKQALLAKVNHIKDLIHRYHQGDDPVLRHAPCAILFLGKKRTIGAHDDCIGAQHYAMLAADSIGIGSCIIGFATAAKARFSKQMPIPKGYAIETISIFGIPKYSYPKYIAYTSDHRIM